MNVDLSSPGGNAFALIALARTLALQLHGPAQASAIVDELHASETYAQLLTTLQRHFPAITYTNDPREGA